MAAKPSIPKGTRDFGPLETARRNYIFNTISEAFTLFGFSQIETPAQENLSTLMGKYGEEGDKLLFKILNSGDYLSKISEEELQARDSAKLCSKICEKGLRYDLTVPFARYVVQHRSELQMPFKRFQIQPVWRADRPQKGRYREFYQCDADIVGSESLNNEIELLSLIDYVFSKLKIRVAIKVNNRKILAGLGETLGLSDRIIDITVAIDKLDKIGLEGVKEELRAKDIPEEAITALCPILEMSGSNDEKIETIREVLSGSEIGLKGVDELQTVIAGIDALGHDCRIDVDLSLARGLNYYTGTILEVKALDTEIGSISGGGRYDNLTGVFGMPGLSGVGISFGADRIYDVLNNLDLFPAEISESVKVIFINFGEESAAASLKAVRSLRLAGISSELYPDSSKMKKQMAYANSLAIPFVAMIGEEELAEGKITLRDMSTGEQQRLTVEELIGKLKS